MRTFMWTLLATGFVAGLACGGDGGSGPSGLKASTEYRGIITGSDGSTAGLTLTFASAVSVQSASPASAEILASAVVPVTGIIVIQGGGSVAITGTLDGNTLTVTGGGFTLTGTLSNGKFTGTVTGPGNLSGTFTALASTDDTAAYAYCGTYAGVYTPGDLEESGVFNLVVAGSVVSGGATTTSDIVTFTGRASSGSNGSTTITVNTSTPDGALKVNGTVSADHNTVSGTYRTTYTGETGSSNGSFQGGLCTLSAPSLR